MALDKKTLRALRKRLPSGYLAQVRAKLGADAPSDSYVSQVLNGSRHDMAVITAAIAVAEAYEHELAQIAQRARGRKTTATA